MAFSLGLSAKKGKSETTETSTPNAPDWLAQPWQQLFGRTAALGDLDPSSFIPKATANQTLAFGRAPSLGQDTRAMLGDQGLAYGYNPAEMDPTSVGPAAQAEATRSIAYLGDYQNPFEQDVVNSTIADMTRGAQAAKSQAGQSFVAAGGYGGSRQGVENAKINEGLIRGIGSTTGALRSQGFTTALGAADADASRTTGVSTFNAGQKNNMAIVDAQLKQQAAANNQNAKNTAWQYNAGANDTAAARRLSAAGMLGSEDRANLALLGDLGAQERAILGEEAMAPLTLEQIIAQIYGAAPEDAFVGRTTNSKTKSSGSGISAGISK